MRFAHFTSATSIFIELCWSSALLFFFTENIDLLTFLHLCYLLSLTDLSADVLLSLFYFNSVKSCLENAVRVNVYNIYI